MMRRPDPNEEPSAKQLAAYVDGELDAAAQAQVETWLAQHPEALAEVNAQRNVARLWQATPAPEPSEATWGSVFARIEAALPPAAAMGARPELRRRPWRGWLVFVASVAAVVAVIVVSRNSTLDPVATAPVVMTADPFPVVDAGDVLIQSMDDTETYALVVGEPPPLVVVSAGDVAMGMIEPDPTDGMMPKVSPMIAPMDTPMILAPLEAAVESK